MATKTSIANKTLSHPASTNRYTHRQSQLFRDLELLLDLTPSTFSSALLSLPAELRAHIFSFLLPPPNPRPSLHTCLWGADMLGSEPWRRSIFSYSKHVPAPSRLRPALLLINKQLGAEILALYCRRANLTLHAELRNSRAQDDHFTYSPHILRLPFLAAVSHVRLYVEWNYTLTKAASAGARQADLVRMAEDFCKAVEEVLRGMERVESIEVSVLFFWKYRSGKVYGISMADLFAVEDVLKKVAEPGWLRVLERARESRDHSSLAEEQAGKSPRQESAGVGYKLSSEKKGLEQSGGMEIFVSADLEECMGRKRTEVDFFGNFAVDETLPQPGYEAGAMI